MFRAFLQKLPKNVAGVYLRHNWLWHLVAIILTYVLVISGFDWWYFESTRGGLWLSLTLPAAIIGFFVPIIVPVSLYLWGEARKDSKIRNVAAAAAQAGIIALIISSVYKAFTGRIQPEFFTHLSTLDISREFQFGFLRHGVFWGWPSSHAAVAFAGAVTLALLYPKNKILRGTSILYASYIGFAVSISIHWFSDFLAGAIIGTLIGLVVAKSFQSQNRPRPDVRRGGAGV
ncbi:MAG: phosphatase PAP2 family protein [Candidatus Taylorbacteria bacterium]|nr:phosphatase PAP2 family protein [Candidatus Taylorbacteria bacterium]